MRRLREVRTQIRAIAGWREHRTDLMRWLWRRPVLALGIAAAEAAETLSKKVDARFKLLAQLRVAALVGCEFCLDIGTALAAHSDLTERQLLELNAFEESDAFSADEKLVLRYATALSRLPSVVEPGLRDRLVERFGKSGLTELTAAIAHEHERTRLYVGLGVRPGRFAPDGACRIPAVTSQTRARGA
jgi:AhpD family alkylhydroperoxidase